MREGQASKTAEHNALFRALETRKPPDQRLFDDRYAEGFLSLPYRTTATLARFGPWRRFAVWVIDRGWPGVRPTVVARTRLIDELVDKIVRDVDQVVILGAGFDTRPYRLPALQQRAVFEVDHPDTQRSKQAGLRRVGVRTDDVRFVPTDFTISGLGRALADAGYRDSAPTLFLWEGVTNYLTEAAVDATLRWIAQANSGSHLIVTYIDRRALTHPDEYHGAQRVRATLERAGEQMTFGLAPDDVPAYLAERGLRLVSDEGAADFRRRYLGRSAAAVRGHEFYRVAHAITA